MADADLGRDRRAVRGATAASRARCEDERPRGLPSASGWEVHECDGCRCSLLLVLVLAGCTDAPVNQPPPPPVPTPQPAPTELVLGVDDIGAGFNPHLLAHTSPVTNALATLVLPSVFRPDGAGTLQLDRTIATSAEVVATEPFTVSYELNLEASWSTNAPIAAEDFVYLWERMRGEPGVVDAAGYKLITEVRSRAGGKAVDVVFSQAYPAWQHLFSDLLPAHLLKDAPGSWTGATINGLPASGGPFRIISIDRARGDVLLGRNDLYWDTPTVLDQLVLRRLDPTAMATGLANGDVDVALPEAGPAIRTALGGLIPAPHLQPAPQPTVTQLGMRADTGPLADQQARQGVAAIIDREAIRAAVAPEALPVDAFGLAPSEPGLRGHRARRRAGPSRPGAGRPAAGRRRVGAQPDHRPLDDRGSPGPAGDRGRGRAGRGHAGGPAGGRRSSTRPGSTPRGRPDRGGPVRAGHGAGDRAEQHAARAPPSRRHRADPRRDRARTVPLRAPSPPSATRRSPRSPRPRPHHDRRPAPAARRGRRWT